MGIEEQLSISILGPILQAHCDGSVCRCANRLCKHKVLRAVHEIGKNIKHGDGLRLFRDRETKRSTGYVLSDPVLEMPRVLNRVIEVVVIFCGDLMRALNRAPERFMRAY